jgi:transposase-like protein
MKAGQKKKVYSVEERLAHVEAFKASGKSLREYELATGVKDQTLYNWVSGRNLKTQAKKAEVKKAEVKKAEVKKAEVKKAEVKKVQKKTGVPTPTVIQVRCPKCARYENKAYVVVSVLLNLGILAALVKVVLAH